MSVRAAAVLSAHDEEAAQEALYAAGLTDGLPVVTPTPERVDRILAFSPGLEADFVLGELGPMDGALTVEAAAIAAVMAGCPPELFPYVIAAAEAVADPAFEAGPIQNTTHCVTPFLVINGPGRVDAGFESGVGALGPGPRANLTLGRAVRLMLLNVGGGRPGLGDMANLGSPAKIACCLAEAQEESPFDPLHVALGRKAEENTVTALGVEGPHSFLFHADDPDSADSFLRTLGRAMASPGSNSLNIGLGSVAVILNPRHARLLAGRGWSRAEIQARLFQYASASRLETLALAGRQSNLHLRSEDTLHVTNDPADILIVVAGGDGGPYSAHMPTWGGGSRGQFPVCKPVRTDCGCDAPLSLRTPEKRPETGA